MKISRRKVLGSALAVSVSFPNVSQAQLQKTVSRVCRFLPHPAVKVGCFIVSLVPVAAYTGARALVRRLAQFSYSRCGPGTRCDRIIREIADDPSTVSDAADLAGNVFKFGSRGLKRIWEVVEEVGTDLLIPTAALSAAPGLGAYGERYLELLVRDGGDEKFVPAVFDSSKGVVTVALQIENGSGETIAPRKPAVRLVGDYPTYASANDDGPVASVIEAEVLGPLIGFAPNSKSVRVYEFNVGHLGLLGPKRVVLDFGEFEIETDPFILFDHEEIERLNAHLAGV
ncbi:MAG: hypothetical protein AAFW81_09025 [Pseudomonadota bacterium]